MSSNILPQRYTNQGEPADGAGRGKSFDESTNQQAILRMVLSRIGDMARGRPGGLQSYPAVMPNLGGQQMPPARGVTSGKSRRDPASYGASGGRTGKADGEAVGLGPSFVMRHNGVPRTWTPTDSPMSRGRKVRSSLAGRRETY